MAKLQESMELLLMQALQNIAKLNEKIDNLPTKDEVDKITEKHIKTHVFMCPASRAAKVSKKILWIAITSIVIAICSMASSCF